MLEGMFLFPLEQFKVEILSAFSFFSIYFIFFNVDVVWLQLVVLVVVPLLVSFSFSFMVPLLRGLQHVFKFLVGLIISYVSPIMEWITTLIITLFFFIFL